MSYDLAFVGGPQPSVSPDAVDDGVTRAVLAFADAPLREKLELELVELGYRADVRPGTAGLVDALAPTIVWSRCSTTPTRTGGGSSPTSPVDVPRPGPSLIAKLQGPEEFLSAITAGVAGIVPPDSVVDAIVRTVEAVRISGVAIPRSIVASLVEQVRHGRGYRVHLATGEIDVTDREWEILQLLLQRRSTREMAEPLYVSEGTVRSHVSALVHKLGAADCEAAIAMLERNRRG